MNAETSPCRELRERYLDLLIGALTHTVYAGVDVVERKASQAEREELAEALHASGEARLIFDPETSRAEGRDWPRYAQTMVGLDRLRNVRSCVETVIAEQVPGDLIEAGAWRGGAAILMRAVLAVYDVDDRDVYVADSFQGLPPPDAERYPADEASRAHEHDLLAVPVEEVSENFRRYGLLDDRVRFVEGWFDQSLPALRDHRWALVRIDADMYGSTIEALTNLYDGLAPGGFLIVDDFALEECRRAVEDFRRDRGIDEPIEQIDWTGVFWRKRAGDRETTGP